MAIKDQCNKCRKQGTVSCTENIVFDSASCPSYANKINIDKVEEADNTSAVTADAITNTGNQEETVSTEEQTFVYTREYLKQNTEIRGWLTFFIVMMLLGGFFSFVYPIATYNPDDYAGSFFLAIADPIQGLMLFGLACYTAYSFYDRQPNAVFLAKTYNTQEQSKPEIEVIDTSFCSDEWGSKYVCGTIKNNSTYSKRAIIVNINLYDSQNNLIGNTATVSGTLHSGTQWKFKAPIAQPNANRFEIVNIDD